MDNLPIILSLLVVFIVFYGFISYKKIQDEKKIKLSEVFLSSEELKIKELKEKEKNNQKSFIDKKRDMLVQSKTGISMGMYMGIAIISMSLVFLFLNLVFRNPMIALAGSLVGFKIPDIYVNMKREKNILVFNQNLIKALRRMASTLNAGGTVKQAIEDVVNARSIPSAIRDEFEEVLANINYGDTIEKALYKLYDRTASEDVKFMAISVEVQRTLGGDMAQTFDGISKTISNRFLLESEVKGTLSQAQASSTILAFIPIVLFGGILMMNPTHFDILRGSFMGNLIMIICIAMMVFGTFLIRKISKIKF